MDAREIARKLRIRSRSALARRLGIDARALAAFRVTLGLLLLVDLLLRSRDLVAFYTDVGVLPRAVLREQFPALSHLSVHTVSGAAWVQVALFLVAAGSALALVFGYRTTLAAAISWLLLVSLHARNPLVLSAGDSLLRRLLFWGLFLPLGERWSVDSLRAEFPSRRRVASVATAALLIQVVVVYGVNGALKLRGDRWLSGDAVRYVFSLDQFTVLFGDLLAEFPALLVAFDWLWLGMLACSPLLVVLTGRRRTVLVSLFAAMHLGMALTMNLGLFPFIALAGLIPFLPGRVWDATGRISNTIGQNWNAITPSPRAVERTLDRALPRRSSVPVSWIPPALAEWKRRFAPPIAAGLLALALVWNAAALGFVSVPDGGPVADVSPEDNSWDMFAPEPLGTDGWYVMPGRLESGERIDAFRGSAVEWDRPPNVARIYPNSRWRKYLVDLWRADDADLRHHLAGYLCWRWNADHDDELGRIEVHYVEQPTRLDAPEPTRRVELGRYSCDPN